MNRSLVPTLMGSGVALAVGIVIARIVPPENSRGVGNATAKPNDPVSADSVVQPAETALARAIRTEKGAHRWLIVLAQAERANAEQMPALIRSAGNDSAMIRMLAARWAELDPKNMFASLYADYLLPDGSPGTLPGRWELTNVLFDEWIKKDADGLVKALDEVPDFSGRQNLRMTVASELFKTDVEKAMLAMKEWNIRHYVPDMNKVSEWAARDPRHAADVVAGFGGEYMAQEAMKQVGKAWAKSDPEAGLRYAMTLNGGPRASLASEIMGTWAQRDIKAAVSFATAQDDPLLRASLAQGLVNTWAKSDPAAALDWSQENLRGAARAEAISGLIKTVAEKDIQAAGELVSGMEPGAAQNRACASIFETWFNKGLDQREAAFAWLAELPDPGARSAALERVQWNWVFNDPVGVREFVSGPYGHLASRSLFSQVARTETAKNPETAMAWAENLPKDRAADARRAVLESWLQVRPDGATAYALKLPAGSERDSAIEQMSQWMIFQSSGNSLDWFRKLTAADRTVALKSIQHIPLDPDRKRQLDEILKTR